MIRVLFVCLGNICRSPMAEGIFAHLVKEAGLSDQIAVDSAGTGSWHVGEPPHRGTQDVLARNGIRYSGRARQVRRSDFEGFDYILAMDHDNLMHIRSRADSSSATIRLFMDYAEGHAGQEVPDPYYSGKFDEVYALVRRGAEGLLAHIREEHNL